MPADDAIKPAVVAALQKDGWTITEDPYRLICGTDNLYVDLAADRAIVAAERAVEKIAVEIKSFSAKSLLREFQTAFGQFMLYRALMEDDDPDRKLYVAVGDEVYDEIQARPSIRRLTEKHPVPFILVRLATAEVVSWTS